MAKVHTDFDHNSRDFRADPIPVYKRLRAAGVGRSTHYGGMWVASKYEDVQTVSYDVENFSPAHGTMIPPMGDRPLLPMESDPPLHTQYRKILIKRFSPQAIKEWVPIIRDTARGLLDELLVSPPCDLSLGYAKLLPTAVICRMLGIEFKPEFQKWVEDTVYRRISHPQAAKAATEKIYAMFTELLPERRRKLGDDLISLVLTAEIEGERLSEEVVLDFCNFLLVAGLDNTNLTIRALLHRLAIDRTLQRRLVGDRSLIDAAVEEALRFFSPVTALGRHAVNDASLGGCPVRKGEKVLMLFACANRDPKEFDDPDTFNIDRFPNRHVAFGVGLHRCLGSNLARAEVAVAIEEVLNVLPEFSLAAGAETRWDDLGPLLVVPGSKAEGASDAR